MSEVYVGRGVPRDSSTRPDTEVVVVSLDAEEAWRAAAERFPKTAEVEAWTLGKPGSGRTIRWIKDGQVQHA